MIVLDTNVLSELMRPTPHRTVEQWLRTQQVLTQLTTTVMTEAELRYGALRLPSRTRRDKLMETIERLLRSLAPRILSFDRNAARAYAEILNTRTSAGRPMAIADALIAAICHCHGATLATRNVRDFEQCGIALVNPWAVSPGSSADPDCAG